MKFLEYSHYSDEKGYDKGTEYIDLLSKDINQEI
jgi:hypothetical protein